MNDTDQASAFPDPVAAAAQAAFGIRYLFPWQRLVIANILDAVEAVRESRLGEVRRAKVDDGLNVSPHLPNGELSDDDLVDEDGAARGRQIVLLPTGAGKSLCFQVPALLLTRQTLVIYPLLALQGDQARRMAESGLEAVLFRGGQDAAERRRLFARLEGTDGQPPARLIIANPEVLAAGEVLERISARKIDHLAIDEAHCVSEWGDSFRPAYLELGKLIERLDPPAVTAFTATASPEVLARVAEVLYGGTAHLVRGDSDRPNIAYEVYRCRAKDAALVREAKRRPRPLVVFCSTRGGTERVARRLRVALGDEDIRFYHAGLQREEKTAVETWFHGHPNAILCATCAWGMGVDKKDVRTVIHRDVPPTAEAYVQEAGRGGRDGGDARAILLWSPEDAKRIDRLADSERRRAEALRRFAESGKCRRQVLLEALGDPKAGPEAPAGESVACSGCDVCEGKAQSRAGDETLVLRFIERNDRALTRQEAVAELCAAGNRHSRNAWGGLFWMQRDFLLILGELEKAGRVVELTRWPWKGRLAISRGTSCRRKTEGLFPGRSRLRPPRPVPAGARPWRRPFASGTSGQAVSCDSTPRR